MLIECLLLFERRQHHSHTLTFEGRHIFGTAIFLKLYGEAQKLLLALLCKLYGASPEENGGLDLAALLEEALRMLELELEIVFIGIGAETDFLDNYLGGVGFHLLGLFSLLIQVLLVVQYLAHGGIGLGTDFNQIEAELIRYSQSPGYRVYPLLRDIVPDKAYLRSGNPLVDIEFVLVRLGLARIRSAVRLGTRRFRSVRCCDS